MVVALGLRVLFVPKSPRGNGLQVEHLQPVFHNSAMLPAFLHEACVLGIIDKVEEQVLGCEMFVGDVRCVVHVGKHADG